MREGGLIMPAPDHPTPPPLRSNSPSHLLFAFSAYRLIVCICATAISAHIGSGQIMGWGEKAIEVRSVETGLLDGVFMHKRAQTFRFLCERNEKVSIYT